MTSTLTATQLRNARKRRALKRTKRGTASSTETPILSASPSKRRRPTPSRSLDPSQQYIDNPYAAPIVKAAQKFFQDVFQNSTKMTPTNYSKTQPKPSSQTISSSSTVFPIHLGPKYGWRTVVKLPVRGENPPKIGLFVPGSHQILPVVDPKTHQCLCSTHHPAINRAILRIQQVLEKGIVTAYSEQTGQGLLRHVALSVEHSTQRVQLVLVWNDEKQSSDIKNSQVLNTLWQSLVSQSSKKRNASSNQNTSPTDVQWHSIWVHYNALSKHSNAIYNIDGPWDLLYSPPSSRGEERRNSVEDEAAVDSTSLGIKEYLREEEIEKDIEGSTQQLLQLPRIPLYFPPQVFRQGNLTAFAKIVLSIRRYWIQSDLQVNKCLELYGGVGTIGLHLVDLLEVGGTFVGSDENPYNIACFDASVRSWRRSQATPKKNMSIRYASAAATEMVVGRQEHRAAQVMVVDPPRKGLDLAVAQALTESPPPSSSPQTLFYVSCGFEALMRDYAILTNPAVSRPWTLQQAEGHILFPGSDAIETLAIFTR